MGSQNLVRRPIRAALNGLDHIKNPEQIFLVNFEHHACRDPAVLRKLFPVKIIKEFVIGINGVDDGNSLDRNFNLPQLAEARVVRTFVLDPAELHPVSILDLDVRPHGKVWIDLKFKAVVIFEIAFLRLRI